jgi:hypothetical protein
MMDRPLRFLRLWQTIGVLLIGLVIYLSLTPYPIEVMPGEQGDKYDHVLAYATLMFWFAQIHAESRARFGLALGFVAMGVGLEFLQRLTGLRTFEVGDMTASAFGVCVGWIASPPRLPHLLRRIEARWPRGS